MDFTPVVEHLKEYYLIYILFLGCAIPLVYVTRRYSVPFIFYATETIIYMMLMHAAVGVMTRVAAWFKDQSSMKRAFDIKGAPAPEWTTPWLQFWDRELYKPETLFYVEIVFALIILTLVWRYRPMRVKRRPAAPPSQKAQQYLQSRNKPTKGNWGSR